MKTHLFFWVIIFFTISVHAQVIVKENKLWSNTLKGTDGWNPYESYYIKFQEDTIINSNNYKKIWRSNDSLQTNWYVDGYIREDSMKRVFLYHINYEYGPNVNIETMIYDLSISIGDSIELPFSLGHYLYLDSIGYEIIENSTDSIKKLFLYSKSGYEEAVWYENIGSSKGVLAGLNLTSVTGADFFLVCYYENDTLKYHNNYFSSCFPEPYPDDIKQINKLNDIKIKYEKSFIGFDFSDFNTINSQLTIYNIYGSKVMEIELNGENIIELYQTDLQSGIYLYQFQNKEIKLSNKFVIK